MIRGSNGRALTCLACAGLPYGCVGVTCLCADMVCWCMVMRPAHHDPRVHCGAKHHGGRGDTEKCSHVSYSVRLWCVCLCVWIISVTEFDYCFLAASLLRAEHLFIAARTRLAQHQDEQRCRTFRLFTSYVVATLGAERLAPSQ